MSQPCTSSGSIAVTAGASVIPAASGTSQLKSGTFHTLTITAAAATATCQLYDGTSTSGVLLATLSCVANTTEALNISDGCAYDAGLFIVVTGVGAIAVVHYKAG